MKKYNEYIENYEEEKKDEYISNNILELLHIKEKCDDYVTLNDYIQFERNEILKNIDEKLQDVYELLENVYDKLSEEY